MSINSPSVVDCDGEYFKSHIEHVCRCHKTSVHHALCLGNLEALGSRVVYKNPSCCCTSKTAEPN